MDPYSVLGINRDASLDDIKKAYRKLAKKYHPDLNPGNKEAEKRFKAISHAFDLLGTEEARRKYDRGETEEQKREQNDEFSRKNASDSYFRSQQEGKGRYSYSFGEDVDANDFFESLFGAHRGRSRSPDAQGQDVTYKIEVDFRTAATGGDQVITLPNGRTLQVKIPAGIESGKKLRFKGQGGAGIGRGSPGDAYVEIMVRPKEGFRREGRDIYTEVPISFLDAITGIEMTVSSIDGPLLIKVPPGVSTGTRIRLKGKGGGTGTDRGNLFVVIKIVMPKNVDPALREEVEKLKSRFNYKPE